MLEIGKNAPSFTLKNEKNESVSLSDYKGKNVVLFFYPKDNTPGCTKESIAFSDHLAQFEQENTVVLGVSKDSVASHEKFCNKYDLKITLLSDPELDMIKDYGVWQEKKNYGKTYMGIVRSTYLINTEGVIEKVWTNVKVKDHVEAVLEQAKQESVAS